ncbi:MAG: hypothetical protein WB421_06425 [Terriglobales bacterium]|jgi:hypothetical protein
MADGIREVRLPSDLCQAAEQRYGARFGSLEQFLEFVLQRLLQEDAAQMDQAEQRIIEERLKDLGYI